MDTLESRGKLVTERSISGGVSQHLQIVSRKNVQAKPLAVKKNGKIVVKSESLLIIYCVDFGRSGYRLVYLFDRVICIIRS